MNVFLAYRVHGLTVRSAMEIPELCAAPADTPADISVEFGEVPPQLPTVTGQGPLWQTGDGRFLLEVPEVARYLVMDGNRVVVDRMRGAAPGDVRLYLLGTALGALLHQRGLLALHAGAVEVNGQAVAFAGNSGSGKSTLVAHLRQRGYRLIGDDLLAVHLDADGQPWAQPSFARIKLWADALRHLRHEPERLTRDHTRLEKFHLSVAEDHREQPLPLARIYLLADNPLDDDIHLEPLRGLDAVNALARVTYKPRHLKALGLSQRQFQQCSKTASRIQVARLRRPKYQDRMAEVLDRLEAAWNQG